jgi:transposase
VNVLSWLTASEANSEIVMRGGDVRTGSLFSYVDIERRVRRDHPLQTIRRLVNEALGALEADFAALYSGVGRPSIPPEKLLRAMLLQAFYSIRSERQLMERLDFDLLFRWPHPEPVEGCRARCR